MQMGKNRGYIGTFYYQLLILPFKPSDVQQTFATFMEYTIRRETSGIISDIYINVRL